MPQRFVKPRSTALACLAGVSLGNGDPVDGREATERFVKKRDLALVREAGANEAAEERVRLVRFALEFRVILAGEENG